MNSEFNTIGAFGGALRAFVQCKRLSVLTMAIISYIVVAFNVVKLHCDAAEPWGMYFQDSASPIMEGIVNLHDHISYFLILILFAVTWMMAVLLFSSYVPKGFTKSTPYNSNGEYELGTSLKDLNHGSVIEVVWTISPAIILVLIAFPSFRLLYLMDEMIEPTITIKAIGFYSCFSRNNIYKNKTNIGGLKLYISNKIKDASTLNLFKVRGQKNNYICRSFNQNCRAINRNGPHNIDVISVMVGSLLGDAYAHKRSGEGVRLSYRQSIVHKEYLFYLWTFFYNAGYTTALEPRMYTRNVKNKTYYGYEFNTLTFRSLNFLHKLFYTKGKKSLDKRLLHYVNRQALAVWIMDDGGKAGKGLRLSCNAFTYSEVSFLKEILEKKFNLSCTIQNIYIIDKYSIYILKSSMPTLIKLVYPYMHKSMLYKLDIS